MRLIKSLIILLCLLQLSSFAQVNYNSDITISPTGALSGTNAGWAFNGPYNLVPSGNLNGFIFSGSTPTCSASSYHTFGSFGTGWSTGQAQISQPSGWNYDATVNFGHTASWRCNVPLAGSTVNTSYAAIHGVVRSGALILKTTYGNTSHGDLREYMYVRLARPLMHGKTYHLRYTVAAAHPSGELTTANVWQDKLGVYLSAYPPNWEGAYTNIPVDSITPTSVTPEGQIISDTGLTVEQDIIGNGEEWLMVGSFSPLNAINYSGSHVVTFQSRYIFDNFAIYDPNCENPIYLVLPQPPTTPYCHPTTPISCYSTTGFDNYRWYVDGVLQSDTSYFFNYVPQHSTNISLAATIGTCVDSISYFYPVQDINFGIPADTFLFCGDPITIDPLLQSNYPIQYSEWTNLANNQIFNGSGPYSISEYGDYEVHSMTISGCNFRDTLHVIPRFLPTTNAQGQSIPITQMRDVSCPGENDGYAIYNFPGLDSLHYDWGITGISDTSAGVFNSPAYNFNLRVYDNDQHCTVFYPSIINNFDSCAVINGTVYFDTDTDCLLDTNEQTVSSVLVYSPEFERMALSDSLGNYVLRIPPGPQHIYQSSYNHPLMGTLCEDTLLVNPTSFNQVINGINFGDTITVPVYDAAIVFGGCAQLVPGHLSYIPSVVENSGNLPISFVYRQVISDSLWIDHVEGYFFGTWDEIPLQGINGDTCTWLLDLNPGQSAYFRTWVEVPPNPALVGNTLYSYSEIIPLLQDDDSDNNHFDMNCLVTGSYDPNRKNVNPAGNGEQGLINASVEDFHFLIEFQNTGTAPADNVYIEDTLSSLFNLNTLQLMGASHAYQTEIRAENLIRFVFPNIQLADSLSNEPESHGWIAFKVKRQANATSPGTMFQNTALIYFDYNEPVITNTTVNTITEDIVLAIPQKKSTELIIYPNPAATFVQIQLPSIVKEIRITDLSGRVLLQKNCDAQLLNQFDIHSLSNGLYLFDAIFNDGSIIQRKLVVSKP